MKKIALIGVENSHAPAFAKLIKNNPDKYGDIEIVGVYSYDGAAARKMVDDGLAPMAADTSSYFLDKVDAVINTARHGDNHYEYSMPYIKAGVPMFIDKPFCIMPHNAAEMIAEAEKSGALLCGGSCLKFAPEIIALKSELDSGVMGKVLSASLSAPVQMSNPYGNFYFYAGHLAQMLITMFGLPVSVYAAARERTVTVLCRHADFETTLHFAKNYVVLVHAENGTRYTTCENITDLYEPELDEFCNMLRTGKMEETYDALTAPVALLNAIYLSYSTGTEQPVKPIR
ncbi:MAG: Gfo/Idh/MocA family oxidoreductase [Ruminococcaceae bacterium]|nr:Gfo/Idh/MocA family oxidoreductase [Oscillospiraceae bacterium]